MSILNPETVTEVVTLEQLKVHYITLTVANSNGNMAKAAKKLKISVATVKEYCKFYKVKWVWKDMPHIVMKPTLVFEYETEGKRVVV